MMPFCFPGASPWRPLASVILVLCLAIPAAGQIFDSDNMVLLSHQDLYGSYNDVWAFVGNDGREYVIQGTTSGTAWWDVDDPVNPVLVKFIPGAGSVWRDMAVSGDYAYVGTEGGGGIQIIDLTDPTNPTHVGTYTATVSACHNLKAHPTRPLLCVVGGYAGTINGGMQILDISNPTAPVEVGQWDNRYIHDLSFEGNLVHACLIYDNRYRMIDISDSSNPVVFGNGWASPQQWIHASWPVGDGVHTIIAEETGGGHVKSIDRSTPTAPVMADAFNPNPAASVHNVHVEGSLCYASWYAYGTRVIDVSDPTNLVEVGFFDTFPPSNGGGVGPGNWGVYPHLPSGTVASNDGTFGLFLMKYDPDAARLDGTVSSSAGGTLAGATVEYDNHHITQVTEAGGAYRFSAFAGAGHLIRASAWGYAPDSATVSAAANGTTTTNFVLTKYTTGGLAGRVTDDVSGLPIEAVELSLVGAPLTAVTDANGDYSFPEIPTQPGNQYSLHVTRYGYAIPADRTVNIATAGVLTEDITLVPAAAYEDFASPTGWTVTSDPSTSSGFWTFGEPFGTYSGLDPFQPELDHTLNPEDQCAVTGNLAQSGIGTDDVDGGATRLFSPVYDLSGMTEPHAFYYRWYAVNDFADQWQVHVSDDGGSSWMLLESTPAHENFWQAKDFDLTGMLGALDQVQFRFTAEDPDPGQVVEAALDDFTLYDAQGGGATAIALPVRSLAALELAQNFPNPFPTRTTIDFSVPAKGVVELSVFDIRGARVANLVDGELEAGRHQAVWDGRNGARQRTAAGVYFYKLVTEDGIRTRKMIRID